MSSVTPSPLAWNTAASPFASVIETNYAPTSAELAQLKMLLVAPQQELQRLQSEIASVRAVFDGLLYKKKRVETYIEAHQALMSPIRQLPSETLGEIFLRCLPLDSAYGVRSLKHAPLLMTTICRNWRRIAIETPRLWSSIHIYFPPHLGRDPDSASALQRIAGVNLWLQRSGILPVSISLHGGSADPYHWDNQQLSAGNMALLIKSLLGFRDRIQHMRLALNQTDMMAFHELLPADSSFPHLISLVLDEPPIGRFPLNTPLAGGQSPYYGPLISRMPMLRKLEITISRGGQNIHYHDLPCRWGMLTNLSIHDSLAPADLLGILTKSGALKNLKASLTISVQNHHFNESALPTVTLHDLNVLNLTIGINSSPNLNPFNLVREEAENLQARSLAQISTIFSSITCPSLKEFHVSMYNSFIASPQVPFLSLPLHGLETLYLNMSLTSEALTECLSLASNLVSLDFTDTGNIFCGQGTSTLEDCHLASLTPSATNPLPLCHQLRHFRMTDCTSGWSHRWSTQVLTDFIAIRRDAKLLESCKLFFVHSMPSPFSDEEIHRLQKSKQDRLKLLVHKNKQPKLVHEDGPMSGLPTSLSTGSIADPGFTALIPLRKFETDIIV